MDKGIYTALSGGIAKSHELDLIANNLANANTPGFKRDTGTFNEYLTELRNQDSVEAVGHEIAQMTVPQSRPQGDKSFVEMDGVYTDYRQGTLEKTNRPLDVALEGKGFFEVLTPAGVRYTRQGNFSIAPDGRLVTQNGYSVLSKPNKTATQQAAGNLVIFGVQTNIKPKSVPARDPAPEVRQITLGQGPIEITPDGIIRQNGVQIAELNVEEFHENQWLEKAGNSYYRNVNPENLKPTSDSKIHQGYQEGSNVNPISEMTRLIEATRAYESHMQAVKTYSDIDSKTVNDIARTR